VTSWTEPEKVAEYVGRIGRVPQRLAGEAALLEQLPVSPKRVLDLGCGDGRLVGLVLEARPDVEEIVGVDNSPPMLERARDRFRADARVAVQNGDLREPLDVRGHFDLVTSGFAIHHVADDRKRALFAEVRALLTPGGMFANLEVVASPTRELQTAFETAIGRPGGDPEDRLAPVEAQLTWMRDAGLEQVDCMWKWRGFALLVGQAPAA
jgi:tRNA (cmo5U34)-methyltransferase